MSDYFGYTLNGSLLVKDPHFISSSHMSEYLFQKLASLLQVLTLYSNPKNSTSVSGKVAGGNNKITRL